MTCANNASIIGYPLRNVTLANGVLARGFYMGVGNPMQYFAMSPDLSADDTWVSNSAQCAKGQEAFCTGQYGGIYNISQSRTYTSTAKASWNGSLTDFDGSTQPPDSFTYFNDDIFPQGNTSYAIRGFPLLTRNTGYNIYSSLGLGLKSLFIDQMVKLGLVRYRGWGLWMGSKSTNQPVAGTLWLGGYDSTRLAGDLTSFSYADESCELCFSVTDLTYQYSGGSAPLVANSSQIFTIQLNPYFNTMLVPSGVYQNLIQVAYTTGVYNKFQQTNNWLAFNTTGNVGNLSVTLRKGSTEYKTIIPASEWLTLPHEIDDNSGNQVLYNTSYSLSLLRNDSNPDPPHFWGGPFFTMNYMVMDYEQKMFQLGAARQGAFGESDALVKPLCTGIAPPTQTPSTSPTPTATTTPKPGHSAPTGAIAGGVVGGVAGIIIVAALIWFLLRSRRRERAMREERDAALAGGSEAGRPDRMSQITPSSPTVVSETHGPNKAFAYQDNNNNNVDQWLHGQPVYVPPQYAPAQNYPPQQQHSIPRRPVPSSPPPAEPPSEMPAYQYK